MSVEAGYNSKEDSEILYSINVSDVKAKYSKKRIIRAIIAFTLQALLLIVLAYFYGVYALIGLLIAITLFLPTPLPPAPSNYEITERGIRIGDKERRIFNNKRLSFKINEREMSVSVTHSLRGDIILLYSPDPNKLYDLLISLRARAQARDIRQIDKKTDVTRLEKQQNKKGVQARINIVFKRVGQTIFRLPPLIIFSLASILAFYGLVTGNSTTSIAASDLFFIGIISLGIWYLYRMLAR